MMLCKNCGRARSEHGSIGGFCPGPYSKTFWQAPGQAETIVGGSYTSRFGAEAVATPRAVNPKFHSAIKRMAELHDKKSADYANDANRYANFEEAASTAGVSVEQVFLVLIGVKLARLRELTANGKTPNNESIQDTRLDLAVYSTLYLSYFEDAV